MRDFLQAADESEELIRWPLLMLFVRMGEAGDELFE
jgi:hypothetical protein